jgi:sorbitol-specific phosphotransferase system component IIC
MKRASELLAGMLTVLVPTLLVLLTACGIAWAINTLIDMVIA